MKKISSLSVALALASALITMVSPAVLGNKGALATITGTVKDSKGKPLAGAVISLIKEGATQVSKQTRSGPDG